MNNSAWRKARTRANLDNSVHSLKHTFGSRLRNAGVSFEDRQQLLGHKNTNMSTHYSAASLQRLVDAAESVVTEESEAVVLEL